MATDDVALDEDLEEDLVLRAGDPTEEGEAAEEPLEYDENDKNLAPIFAQTQEGEEEAKKIVDKVIRDFEGAHEASQEFRENMAKNWELFMGKLPPKSGKFAKMANIHVPMAIENISRVYLRAHGELFGDFKRPFAALPTRNDPEALAEAEIVTKHTNWQLRVKIPDFQRQTHRIVLGFFMIGDVTVASYRDTVLQSNRHEVLTPDQFVIPYVYTTTMPDYSDCPFRVRVLEYYKHDLEKMKGEWHGIDEVLKRDADHDDEPETPLADAVADTHGQRKPENKDIQAPYKCLWYEGWMMLPNQTEERFVCAVVEKYSRTLLKLYIHEYEDWQDAERYQMQLQEMEQYRQAAALHAEEMATRDDVAQKAMAAEAQGEIGEQMLQEGLAFLQSSTPEPPLPPAWMVDPMNPDELPRPVRKTPVHLFTHIVCIEPFVGNLGVGYGKIQADLNVAANILLCQAIDQAAFGNLPANLVDESLVFKGDPQLEPGALIKVQNGAGNLKDAIHQLSLGQANPQLIEILQMAWGWAQSSMQSPNVLSGESGKSGETRGGLLARIEQASKQLSVLTGKIAEGMGQVYKNNSFLNFMHMDDVEIVSISTDVAELPETLEVSRNLYAPGYDWLPTSDLRYSPEEQKIMEADQAFQLTASALPIHQNRQLVMAALIRSFEVRGWKDLAKIAKQGMEQQAQAAQQQQEQQAMQQQGQQPQQGAPPPNGAPPGPPQ